jgi:hypothetical protein
MPAPISWIGGPRQQAPSLELVEQADDVGRLDPEREGQLALGDGPLGIEVVEDRELRPSQAALGEAPAQAPRGGAREPQEQESASRAQRGVPDVGRRRGSCGRDRIHGTDSYSS